MYQLSYLSIEHVSAIIEARRKEYEIKDRSEWMQARYLAYIEIRGNPHIDNYKKPRTPQDLFLLKGEKKVIKKVNIKKSLKQVALMRKRWNIN